MWLPLEESHEVIGFVRAVGGERHWGGEGHCRGVGHCRGEGHCGGEGQGRERGTVSTQQAHVALCETRALHLYTSQCSVAVCQVSKGMCFYFQQSYKEVVYVPPVVCTSRNSLGSVVVVYPTSPPTVCGCVLVCVVCGETHRQHCLVVTPVTSSLRGTHPPVSSTALMIWRRGIGRGGGVSRWSVRMAL